MRDIPPSETYSRTPSKQIHRLFWQLNILYCVRKGPGECSPRVIQYFKIHFNIVLLSFLKDAEFKISIYKYVYKISDVDWYLSLLKHCYC
jgi:hypothetical protein